MLLRSVIGQQLSVKAAATIYDRVLGLFGGSTPTPEQLLEVEPQASATSGSRGARSSTCATSPSMWSPASSSSTASNSSPTSEVIAEITAIRGFGLWSAQMFLIFFCERPDVLPAGDLGIRKAAQAAYDLEQMPAPAELEELAEPWRPHRTLASIYLWESLANEPI